MPPMHSQLCMCNSSTCTDEWHPTTSTLCLLSHPHRKVQVVSLSYAQNKAQKYHPKRFPCGHWRQFRMQHLSHFGARLQVVEEREKERKKEKDEIFGCFRFATLKWLLLVAIITVHWAKPFKLLCVFASICSLEMISALP